MIPDIIFRTEQEFRDRADNGDTEGILQTANDDNEEHGDGNLLVACTTAPYTYL